LTVQCRDFLSLFHDAVAKGGVDVANPAYTQVRDFLGNFSRSRALQGFSPRETAIFVFSLKEPLFNTLNRDKALPPAARNCWLHLRGCVEIHHKEHVRGDVWGSGARRRQLVLAIRSEPPGCGSSGPAAGECPGPLTRASRRAATAPRDGPMSSSPPESLFTPNLLVCLQAGARSMPRRRARLQVGRDAKGRSLGVRAALRQEDHAVGASHYSTTANGTCGVTSTTDVPRRGSPLRLRATSGLSRRKRSWGNSVGYRRMKTRRIKDRG
jgi:hypothetical protein